MTSASLPKDHDLMTEINITPFTDVLLVLLIIFMILAAIATPPGFQKKLHGPLPSRLLDAFSPQIAVRVTDSGALFIDGVHVPPNALYSTMARKVKARTTRDGSLPRILVFADANARYDWIIKILDAAREAGDEDVGFVTP